MQVTRPEDLTPEQLSIKEVAPNERTAPDLLPLLASVAEVLDVPQSQLVQLQGAILNHGSIGLYGRLPFEGAATYQSVAVGWFRPDPHTEDPVRAFRELKPTKPGMATVVEYGSEDEAVQLYKTAARKLDEEDHYPTERS